MCVCLWVCEGGGGWLVIPSLISSAAAMAQSPSPVPVPRPRPRRTVKNPNRQKLVDLFGGFSAGTVSDEQIQAARECIHYGGYPSARYIQIPFVDILGKNEVCGWVDWWMCVGGGGCCLTWCVIANV